MTPPRTSDSPRQYKALAISCPACHARAGEPCVSGFKRVEMRGVHRRRDLEWNRLEWLRETGAPTLV